jgi:hypothetical protein
VIGDGERWLIAHWETLMVGGGVFSALAAAWRKSGLTVLELVFAPILLPMYKRRYEVLRELADDLEKNVAYYKEQSDGLPDDSASRRRRTKTRSSDA